MSELTRDVRQQLVLPRELFSVEQDDGSSRPLGATIIGVGATGRQVALILAVMGVPVIDLFDHDTVGVENLSSQGFHVEQVGREKVRATADDMMSRNPGVRVAPYSRRWSRLSTPLDVVFCCVDSMEARRLIWESVKSRTRLFIEGRMAAEVFSVHAVECSPPQWDYATTLFTDEEAYRGACTTQTTFYAANMNAALMVAQFTRWLRGHPLEQKIEMNLLDVSFTAK